MLPNMDSFANLSLVSLLVRVGADIKAPSVACGFNDRETLYGSDDALVVIIFVPLAANAAAAAAAAAYGCVSCAARV